MEYGSNIPGLNYEGFWNKRKKYQMQVVNLFREIKKFNFFEKKNIWTLLASFTQRRKKISLD